MKGVHIFDGLIDLIEHDSQYKSNSAVRKAIHWAKDSKWSFFFRYRKLNDIYLYV